MSSHRADRVLPPIAPEATARLVQAAAAARGRPAAAAYTDAVANSPFVKNLLAGSLTFEWARVEMVSDDPAKGLGLAAVQDMVWPRLRHAMQQARHELKLVSAYFVRARPASTFLPAPRPAASASRS